MSTKNRIRVLLSENNTNAKLLTQRLYDADEVAMSYIVNDRALPTKRDLNAMTAALNCEVKDLYDLNDIDLANSLSLVPEVEGLSLSKPTFPAIKSDARDRSGRIWMDAGSEGAKDRVLEQAKRHGYDGWQQLLVLLETVLNLMDSGVVDIPMKGA